MSAETNPIWMAEQVVQTPITDLKPYAQNKRTHSKASVAHLVDAIGRH